MRILISLIAFFTALGYPALFMPAGASPAETKGALISVVCPDYVDTGIPSPPQGWTATVNPLGGSRINFQQIVVDKNVVACHYSNQKEVFAIYGLIKTFPINYKCSAVKGPQTWPRAATCAPRIKLN